MEARARRGAGRWVLLALGVAVMAGCAALARAGDHHRHDVASGSPCDGPGDCSCRQVCFRAIHMARGTCYERCDESAECPRGQRCDTISERVPDGDEGERRRTERVCR
jgi:hypothetical protein